MIDGQPLHAMMTVPVEGKLGCTIIQANNGRRIDCTGTAATADEALSLGLEAIRKALGW
jgi:hypothetical protein